jgi:hypothetical protein
MPTPANRPMASGCRRALGGLACGEGAPGQGRPGPGAFRRCRIPGTDPVLPGDAVITVDVGNHAYSFGRYFESGGQSVLMPGSIGFGYSAAMGAWGADPDRPVVAVTGDGGLGQYLAEVTTA